MVEDRLSDIQSVRLAAVEKAIDSYNTLGQRGVGDTIVSRATEIEKYLLVGGEGTEAT